MRTRILESVMYAHVRTLRASERERERERTNERMTIRTYCERNHFIRDYVSLGRKKEETMCQRRRQKAYYPGRPSKDKNVGDDDSPRI